ncbi:energy transducer TonB [Rhodohalobacter sp.]|uniref:energy transducer TonB family protein n=1 Tax=Rhodohalobacter sp. TaxID=1974210 RepID=UPI002ACE19E4|nr:energy transducer TonB [Rhodohalobacter sp.]MDZ7755006.1 energy transducer TonB [Rhodohalobacter sp.]
MLDWFKSHFDKEDRFGLAVTGAIHLVLFIIAILYTINMDYDNRPAYIEVTLGEFQSGTIAEQAEVQEEEVATRPNPAEEEPEDPDPEIIDPVETPQQPEEEVAKPVELPEQQEEIQSEEVVETPETEVIDPQNVEVEEEVDEEVVPPVAQEAEEVQEGVETSGVVEGTTGETNVEEGTGNDEDRSAPYELQWEGDLERSPMVQPMPDNQTNEEATITVRFEVHPDGSLGRVVPLRKMNPELEREVMRTLRSWRFSRLPSGVPQESQWGRITFNFVVE